MVARVMTQPDFLKDNFTLPHFRPYYHTSDFWWGGGETDGLIDCILEAFWSKHFGSFLDFDGILRVDDGEISLLSKVLRVEETLSTVSSKTQARKTLFRGLMN